MTPEERKRQAHRDSVRKSMAARRAAEARLVAMHAEEFELIYEEEKEARGIVSMRARAAARADKVAAEVLGVTLEELAALRAAVGADGPPLKPEEEEEEESGPTWVEAQAYAEDDPDPMAKR